MTRLIITTTFSPINVGPPQNAEFSIATVADEPVATLPDDDAAPFSYTFAGTTYTQRRPDLATLTAAMVETATTYITKPSISGVAQTGAAMTLTPAIALTAKEEGVGLPSFQVYLDDVAQFGETGDTYILQKADDGKDLRWTQTTDGVTISSDTLNLVFIDATAPTLLDTVPDNNAINVGLTDNISLVFDEPIAKGTGDIVLREDNGGWSDLETFDAATSPAITIGTTNAANDTLIINPTAGFVNARNYAIRVASTSVEDTSGNAFAGIADDATLKFKSRATTTLSDPLDLMGEIYGWYDFTDSTKMFTDSVGDTQVANGNTVRWIENKGDTGQDMRYTIAQSSVFNGSKDQVDLSVIYPGFNDQNPSLSLTSGMEMYFAISTTRDSLVLQGTRFRSDRFSLRGEAGSAGSPHGSVGTPTYLINNEELTSPTRGDIHARVSTGTGVVAGVYGLDLSGITTDSDRLGIFSHQGFDGFRLKGGSVTHVVLTRTLTPTQRTNLFGWLSQRIPT